MNEAMIGTVEVDGIEYEIDWPFEIDDDTKRSDFAAVYLNGRQVAEFVNPSWGAFEDEQHVLELAFEFISDGGLNDD